MKCGGNVVRVEERRDVHRILVGKPEGRVHLKGAGLIILQRSYKN